MVDFLKVLIIDFKLTWNEIDHSFHQNSHQDNFKLLQDLPLTHFLFMVLLVYQELMIWFTSDSSLDLGLHFGLQLNLLDNSSNVKAHLHSSISELEFQHFLECSYLRFVCSLGSSWLEYYMSIYLVLII